MASCIRPCRKSIGTLGIFAGTAIAIAIAVHSRTGAEDGSLRPPRVENPNQWVPTQANTTDIDITSSQITAAPRPIATEIPNNHRIDPVIDSIDVEVDPKPVQVTREIHLAPAQTKPLLPLDRPEWVARATQIQDSIHTVSVGAFPAATYRESLATLDESLILESRKYVDEYVLTSGSAEKFKQLNADWIRRHWLVKDKYYDAVLETPTATYHQAWIELEIDKQSRDSILQWAADQKRSERVAKLGIGRLVSFVEYAYFKIWLGSCL